MNGRRSTIASPAAPPALLGDIRALIEAAHQRAASAINAELTLLFWHIGQRIHTEVLAGQRAGYGEEILSTLAEQLAATTGGASGRRTCAGWSSSPSRSRMSQLSRHCRDN